jgi:hypothetical protein
MNIGANNNENKIVLVLNLLSTMSYRRMRQWRYSSTILDLRTGWRWVVSFTPGRIITREWAPRTSRVGNEWTTELIWLVWRREKAFVARNWTQIDQHIAQCCIDWIIPLRYISFSEIYKWPHLDIMRGPDWRRDFRFRSVPWRAVLSFELHCQYTCGCTGTFRAVVRVAHPWI